MRVAGAWYRSIWFDDGVRVIDQRQLPHRFDVATLRTLDDAYRAIADMTVRGAPLIAATAAYGLYLAAQAGDDLEAAARRLLSARPTAVNLRWAVDRQREIWRAGAVSPADALRREADRIADEDVRRNESLGRHGLAILQELHRRHPERPLQILTHCNAGWLGTVDWGTAMSPIYQAHDLGLPLHVWVDETRPRNQGALLTAWELAHHGVPHTVIVDNAGGHLMQQGRVDAVLTGTDRTTRTGDVCNKIGTYLKALAAWDNQVPFYVAAPSPSIDWTLRDGLREIPIEERDPREVTHVSGWDGERVRTVRITPAGSAAMNVGFDVTPAQWVTGLITERGLVAASEQGLLSLFPERGPGWRG